MRHAFGPTNIQPCFPTYVSQASCKGISCDWKIVSLGMACKYNRELYQPTSDIVMHGPQGEQMLGVLVLGGGRIAAVADLTMLFVRSFFAYFIMSHAMPTQCGSVKTCGPPDPQGVTRYIRICKQLRQALLPSVRKRNAAKSSLCSDEIIRGRST